MLFDQKIKLNSQIRKFTINNTKYSAKRHKKSKKWKKLGKTNKEQQKTSELLKNLWDFLFYKLLIEFSWN